MLDAAGLEKWIAENSTGNKERKYEFHSVIIVDTWKSNENNGG